VARKSGENISDRSAVKKAFYRDVAKRHSENEAMIVLLAADLVMWKEEALIQGMIVNSLLERLPATAVQKKALLESLRSQFVAQMRALDLRKRSTRKAA
jgi:hypothetical protein